MQILTLNSIDCLSSCKPKYAKYKIVTQLRDASIIA